MLNFSNPRMNNFEQKMPKKTLNAITIRRISYGQQQPYSRQQGFLSLPNDNMVKTIAVALCLCLVCSIIVSASAVLLKPTQVTNQLLDKKKNILN